MYTRAPFATSHCLIVVLGSDILIGLYSPKFFLVYGETSRLALSPPPSTLKSGHLRVRSLHTQVIIFEWYTYLVDFF